MRPALYALVAVVLYSIMNVVVEQKLARYNAVALLLCGYVVMMPLALLRLGYLRVAGEPIAFPAGPFLVLAFAVGILYFAADFFFLST